MLKKMFRKARGSEGGQALVEFVICLPLLILIMCAIVDFGWVYMNEYEMHHASYEASRYASLHSEDSGMTVETLENNMRALIEENLTHNIDNLTISFTWPITDNGIAKVTVEQPVHMLTFVGMTFFGRTYQMSAGNAFYVRMPET